MQEYFLWKNYQHVHNFRETVSKKCDIYQKIKNELKKNGNLDLQNGKFREKDLSYLKHGVSLV